MRKPTEIGHMEIVDLADLPARNIRKGEVLMRLPRVREATEEIRKGVPAGKALTFRFTDEELTVLKLKTAGRVLTEQWTSMIAKDKLTAKGGAALYVGKYRSAEGAEIVYVTDKVETYVRTSSKRRTMLRQEATARAARRKG